MNPRSTGILLLVAAALGAFAWFYEIRGGEARRDEEDRAKQLFPDVEADAVEWVAFTAEDGEAVRAERREGGWEIVSPLRFPGDRFALDGIASAVAQLSSETRYEDPQSPEVYGLDRDEREVAFGAGGQEYRLRMGNRTPVGGNTYAAVGGSDVVYTVPTYRVGSIRRTLDDLREKRILAFDKAAVEGIAASWPGGSVALEKSGEGWRVGAPTPGPADEQTVDDLLSDLGFLRATGFVDAPGEEEESSLEPPDYRVELTLAAPEEGGEPRRLALAVGRALADGTRLARSAQASLYRIPGERMDDLPRKVSAYRFKQLADFAPSEARRIDLAFRPEDGEPVEIHARLGDAGWSSEPEAMDPERVPTLLELLSGLRAEDILAERVGPDELRGLGLDPARTSVVVYGEGSEEAAPLAELRLGHVRDDGSVVAQAGEDPTLYALASEVGRDLPLNLAAFRSRFLAPSEEPDEADADAEDWNGGGEPSGELTTFDELP